MSYSTFSPFFHLPPLVSLAHWSSPLMVVPDPVSVVSFTTTSRLRPSLPGYRIFVTRDVAQQLAITAITRRAARQPLNLAQLPPDILQMIVEALFKSWAKASMVERAAKWFRSPARLFRQQHPHFAWWTGTLPPLSPPSLVEQPLSSLDTCLMREKVPGCSFTDLFTIQHQGKWVNNFAIAMVIASSPHAKKLASFPRAEPLAQACILDSELGAVLNYTCPRVLVHSARSVYARVHYVRNLQAATEIYMCLNLNNAHWVLLRVLPSRHLAEVFVWLGTADEAKSARAAAALVVQYLRAARVLHQDVDVRVHKSPAWRQVDTDSCGIFTLACLFSLLEGRRLSLLTRGPAEWRRGFTSLVTTYFRL